MKKILLLSLLIFSINNLYGKVLLGVDLKYYFGFYDSKFKDTVTNAYTSSTRNRLQLTPRIGIMPSELLEISPFLIFILNTSKRVEEDFNSPYRGSSADLGCGIGAFFHIIRSKIIHLSLGPQLRFQFGLKPKNYDEYLDIGLSIGSPLNFDFHLSDKFAIRFSSNIIDIKYYRYLRESEGETYSYNDFDIDLQSIFNPSLGFFFTLK